MIVPMIVGILMAGPTPEFVLGRASESAAGQAYDAAAAGGGERHALAGDHVTDDDMKASIALTKYMQANCEILR